MTAEAPDQGAPAPVEETLTVIAYVNSALQSISYFDESHWVDAQMETEREDAGRRLWSGDPVTIWGDAHKGGYSVDYGGGEGVQYYWRPVVLRGHEIEDTTVHGLPGGLCGHRGCGRQPQVDGLCQHHADAKAHEIDEILEHLL